MTISFNTHKSEAFNNQGLAKSNASNRLTINDLEKQNDLKGSSDSVFYFEESGQPIESRQTECERKRAFAVQASGSIDASTFPKELLTLIFSETNCIKTLQQLRGVCRNWKIVVDEGVLNNRWLKILALPVFRNPQLQSLVETIDREWKQYLGLSPLWPFDELSKHIGLSPMPIQPRDVEKHIDESLERVWKPACFYIGLNKQETLLQAKAIRSWIEDPTHANALNQTQNITCSHRGVCMIPPELSSFPSLKSFDGDNNSIHAIPEAIGKLHALNELSLAHNSICEISPRIEDLTALQSLTLDHNKLTAFPLSITKISSLNSLVLSFNGIRELPSQIGQLSSLQQLVIDWAYIKEIPSEISNLHQLEMLSLQANSIQNLPKEIGNLRSLTYLDLSLNQIEELPREMGQLTALTNLSLARNKLRNLPKEIGNLSKLENLNLLSNQITYLPSQLGQCSSIKELSLGENPCLFSLFLFNLNRGVFTNDSEMNYYRFITCQDYGCHSPFATFCQALHLNEDEPSLTLKFAKLPEPVKASLREALAPLSEEDFLRERNLLTPVMIKTLKEKWNAMSTKQQEKVFKKVGQLAGYKRNAVSWGQATAGGNVIAHIDAIELIEASSPGLCEGCAVS